VLELDDIAGGIGERDVFDNIGLVWLFDLDDIDEGIGELDLFDNIIFG
jgi:hypothetical protein